MNVDLEPHEALARSLLAQALASDPERLDLAALSVAALVEEHLDPAAVLGRLDELAERVVARAGDGAPSARLSALRDVLVGDEDLSGDEKDYLAPENSSLVHALAHKRALPITLAIIWIEVARRARLPMYGIAFPGHFLVGTLLDGRSVVLDPYHQGAELDEAQQQELLSRVAPQVTYSPELLQAADVRTITWRMLTNLKRSWLERGQGDRALSTVNVLLALRPDRPDELRARAAILAAMGAYRAALADVERCIALGPEPADVAGLEEAARALRSRMSHLN